jgi:hypothetical protein
MKLLLIFSIICLLNKTYSLTDEEEISLNNLSWLYAQFSLTFDPAEIDTPDASDVLTPSDSLIPLYEYFKGNPDVFDNYKSVFAFFDINHLNKIVKSISLNELEKLLEERIKIHQNNIVSEDKTPLTFKKFYALFKIVQSVIESEYPEERGAGERDENIPKITSITTVVLKSHHLMQLFCNARSTNDKEVIRALKRFQLIQFSHNKKLEGREAKMLTLNHAFTEELKGSKDPKPEAWAIHHMIPSKTIVEFYANYFKLLSHKSSEMVKHKRFDWIKINEISVQKTLLVSAETLWTKYGAKVPVHNYDKNVNSGQEDFVRAWYRWPLGLLFYGPKPTDRGDDPSKDKDKHKDKKMYNNQPNDFEAFAASIVGDEYFEKVKTLNTEILEFNKMFTSSSDLNVLNKEAMKLYNRLLNIHKEAPWTNKIIAPFNTDGWKFEKSGKWIMNREFRPTLGEWGIKTLAQQLHTEGVELGRSATGLDMMLSTNDVNAGVSTSFAKELRRRKRHHVEEINCNTVAPSPREGVERPNTSLNEAPAASENGFWCSPFYLRLNPMNYIYCKLSGHENLRFF